MIFSYSTMLCFDVRVTIAIEVSEMILKVTELLNGSLTMKFNLDFLDIIFKYLLLSIKYLHNIQITIRLF